MKDYLIAGFLLMAVVNALAQPIGMVALEDPPFNAQFAKQPVPKVTGKLLHSSPAEIQKTTITYTLVTLTGQSTKTTRPAADGSFKLQLDYPLPYQQIWLQVGDLFYAGLYASKDLLVELDVPKLKAAGEKAYFNGHGVKYRGRDGPLNTYMNEFILFKRSEQLALSSRINQVPQSRKPVATEVLATYGPIFDSLKVIQDEYIATHPSPYGWLLENERLSEFYGKICVAYWSHPMEEVLFDRIKAHKTYLVSNSSTSFYRYLATYFRILPTYRIKVSWTDVALLPDLNETEKVVIDSLRAMASLSPPHPHLVKWQKQLQPRMQQIAADQMVKQRISLLDSLFSSSKADLMKLQLNDSQDIAEQKVAFERILSSTSTDWCRQIAKREYARSVEKLALVNRALASSGNSLTASAFGAPIQQTDFGATLYKISAMNGADFLARLRNSFAGKAIILDRWATWCAPCLAEMPHSKQLQQQSDGLPVVFVYVCTARGSDEGKWKRKVGELKLPGIHFFIDETLDAEVGQYFSFSGYPGYAFIDRKGVYKPGVIRWMSAIKDKAALEALLD